MQQRSLVLVNGPAGCQQLAQLKLLISIKSQQQNCAVWVHLGKKN
jgi:hypothetical protein